MKPSTLCLERLRRIQGILRSREGQVSIREFQRTFGVQRWEILQAVDLGWLELWWYKPPVGRTSLTVREVSNPVTAKLPPTRDRLMPELTSRHYAFIMEATLCLRWGRCRYGLRGCMTDAYQLVYSAKSRRGASASVTRLLKRMDIQAGLEWAKAQSRGKIDRSKALPGSLFEIMADVYFRAR